VERNIAEDETALSELQELGCFATPAAVINGDVIIGFDRKELDRHLCQRENYMEHAKDLVIHLSKDITTLSTNITAFRVKIAFFFLVGPFLVLGSLLVATGGKVSLNPDYPNWKIAVWIFVMGLIYFGLAFIGGLIERHAWDQCNQWRKAILGICQADDPTLADLVEDKGRVNSVVKAYCWSFIGVWISFCVLAFAVLNFIKVVA